MGEGGTKSLKKILVPLDGSSTAETIIPYALSLAQDFDSSITLLHVAKQRGNEPVNEELLFNQDTHAEIKANAGNYLAEVVGGLRKQGAPVKSVVAYGSIAERIASFSQKNRYDLIAMSTRGHSGINQWVYGSVASRVVHSARTPVLLVKPSVEIETPKENARFKKILVPLDGSNLAEGVLPTVKILGTNTGYEVTLVRVVSPISLVSKVREMAVAFSHHYATALNNVEKHYQESAADYLNAIKWELMIEGLTPEVMVSEGEPAEQIIALSRNTERPLIVMATHGRTGISRSVMGSVADRVLRSCSNPVLLIRPQNRDTSYRQGKKV